jgi:3'-phosphoadenosine 5'-phosphosulfate sulfotransferase (PAPS reductase)/FAD synthetase
MPTPTPALARPGQDGLFAPADYRPAAIVPDLASYHVILVSISGGKDSQAALDVTYQAAAAAGATSRLVTVFADLGDQDEWPGTAELAAEHAAHYGIRHERVFREVTAPDGTRAQQTLSEHILQRGLWPDFDCRYCTSDLKRDPIHKLLRRLAAEHRPAGARVRVLSVMGLRAQESPARRSRQPFGPDRRASAVTFRDVDQWLPIHAWDVSEVWARIAQAGTRHHPVYDLGMPRLSCRFCPLSGKSALIRAAQLDPAGAQERACMEQQMGHDFKKNLPMASIIAAADAPGTVRVEDWAA